MPSRINARGGLGAVMAAKGLKAIVIDASGGVKPPIADPAAFRAAQKAYNQALMAVPQTKSYAEYGTAGMAAMCNGFGGLPTRNFSAGQFEAVEAISGDALRDLLLRRGAKAKPPMRVWPAARFAVPMSSAGRTGKRSCRRWNTRRSA